MARVTTSEVKEIFDTDLTQAQLGAFIDAASAKVDDIADEDSSVAASRLAQIEKFLAAHLATTRDPRRAKESLESWSVDNLRETSYGETARMLDPTNVLVGGGSPITFKTPDAKGIRD